MISKEQFSCGNTILTPQSYEITTECGTDVLTPNETKILQKLLEQNHCVVSRASLLSLIDLRGSNDTDRSVDVHISSLRKKLRSIQSNLRIQSKRGVGYYIQEKSNTPFPLSLFSDKTNSERKENSSMKFSYISLIFLACMCLCWVGYTASPLVLDMSFEPMYGYAYIVRNLYIMFMIFIGVYLMKIYLDHKDK